MLHERGDARLADRDVLLAIAARGRDAAHHLAVDHDGKAADENREAALVLREDAEGFLARERVLVVMRRLAVPGGGEGLVHRDLHARHLAAIETPERDRISGGIRDAEYLGHADLLRLLLA